MHEGRHLRARRGRRERFGGPQLNAEIYAFRFTGESISPREVVPELGELAGSGGTVGGVYWSVCRPRGSVSK